MRVTTKITWDMATWEVLEHEFFEYEGSVKLACGPSSGLKALNSTVKGITAAAQSEAATIFGASSTVFNNLISGLQQIVNGVPVKLALALVNSTL